MTTAQDRITLGDPMELLVRPVADSDPAEPDDEEDEGD